MMYTTRTAVTATTPQQQHQTTATSSLVDTSVCPSLRPLCKSPDESLNIPTTIHMDDRNSTRIRRSIGCIMRMPKSWPLVHESTTPYYCGQRWCSSSSFYYQTAVISRQAHDSDFCTGGICGWYNDWPYYMRHDVVVGSCHLKKKEEEEGWWERWLVRSSTMPLSSSSSIHRSKTTTVTTTTTTTTNKPCPCSCMMP